MSRISANGEGVHWQGDYSQEPTAKQAKSKLELSTESKAQSAIEELGTARSAKSGKSILAHKAQVNDPSSAKQSGEVGKVFARQVHWGDLDNKVDLPKHTKNPELHLRSARDPDSPQSQPLSPKQLQALVERRQLEAASQFRDAPKELKSFGELATVVNNTSDLETHSPESHFKSPKAFEDIRNYVTNKTPGNYANYTLPGMLNYLAAHESELDESDREDFLKAANSEVEKLINMRDDNRKEILAQLATCPLDLENYTPPLKSRSPEELFALVNQTPGLRSYGAEIEMRHDSDFKDYLAENNLDYQPVDQQLKFIIDRQEELEPEQKTRFTESLNDLVNGLIEERSGKLREVRQDSEKLDELIQEEFSIRAQQMPYDDE